MAISISAAIPVFRIFSVEKAREFYLDFLGFKVDFEYRSEPDLALFMQVSRDGCALQLSELHGGVCPGSAFMAHVSGFDELHAELIGKKYRFMRPHIEDTAWGAHISGHRSVRQYHHVPGANSEVVRSAHY